MPLHSQGEVSREGPHREQGDTGSGENRAAGEGGSHGVSPLHGRRGNPFRTAERRTREIARAPLVDCRRGNGGPRAVRFLGGRRSGHVLVVGVVDAPAYRLSINDRRHSRGLRHASGGSQAVLPGAGIQSAARQMVPKSPERPRPPAKRAAPAAPSRAWASSPLAHSVRNASRTGRP